MYRKLFLLPVFWQLSQVVPEKTSNNLYRMKSTTLMNYRALTDAVSRDRSPSFSVCPISRTDTGRFMRPPLALSCFLSHSSPSSFLAILSAPLMSALIPVSQKLLTETSSAPPFFAVFYACDNVSFHHLQKFFSTDDFSEPRRRSVAPSRPCRDFELGRLRPQPPAGASASDGAAARGGRSARRARRIHSLDSGRAY